jgi:hypothetical protein
MCVIFSYKQIIVQVNYLMALIAMFTDKIIGINNYQMLTYRITETNLVWAYNIYGASQLI